MFNEQVVSRKDFLKLGGLLAAGMIAIPIVSMFKPVTNIFSGSKQPELNENRNTNYENLIQEWWKWYYTGMQGSPIFGMQFLAGTSGGHAERTMVVQGGNMVFFSPLNFIGKGKSDISANDVFDVKTNMPIINLGRITSTKPFSIGVKDEDGVMMNDVVADGFWFLGGPLGQGDYDLDMWGVSADGSFKNSVKYEVIVV